MLFLSGVYAYMLSLSHLMYALHSSRRGKGDVDVAPGNVMLDSEREYREKERERETRGRKGRQTS